MTHAEIVADYSDGALSILIWQLSSTRNWPERLRAAQAESGKRAKLKSQQ